MMFPTCPDWRSRDAWCSSNPSVWWPATEQTLRTYRLNAEDRQVDLRLELARQ